MPALPAGGPIDLIGGLAPAAFGRAAAHGDAWAAPAFGVELLKQGITKARRAWSDGDLQSQPRIVAQRYFSLGDGADDVADHYLRHWPVPRTDQSRAYPRRTAASMSDPFKTPQDAFGTNDT